MKRWFVFFLIPIAVFGFKIIPSPWLVKTGEISISLGYPTIGIRYGLLDFAEVGFSLREMGGFFKVGFSGGNFAASVGISTFIFENASLIGSVGVRFGNIWASAGAFYTEAMENFKSYGFMGEAYIKTTESGNMVGGMGIFGGYSYSKTQYYEDHYEENELVSSGLYAFSSFKKVWVFDHVDLLGGVSVTHKLGEEFSLLKSLGVVFDVTTSFYLFRK